MVSELENYILSIGIYFNVQYLDDFKQEVLLELFEKGNDYIIERKKNGKLKSYTYKICVRMLYDNGKYHKKYIKPYKNTFEINGSEKTLTKDKKFNEKSLYDLIERLNGNDKILLQHYILSSCNKTNLSNKSNIKYSSLCKMLKRLNTKIKESYKIEDFYD